jgi:hypothetical protein
MQGQALRIIGWRYGLVPVSTTIHQRVLRNLEFLLIQFVRKRDLGKVFDALIGLVFGEGEDRRGDAA